MKAVLFGATGMVGQGVLRACLASDDVTQVLVVGRTTCGVTHPKLRELVHADLYDYRSVESELGGYDVCYFCLGVSAGGMKEADYQHVTYDLTLAAATTLLRLNPAMTFCYVSGDGTDSTEKGSAMWARVKGKTENALLALGFRRAFMFRPGYIQPMDGIKSKTPAYRVIYAIFGPLYPLLKRLFPKSVTSTDRLGTAMVRVGLAGYEKQLIRNVDINAIAASELALR